MFRHVVLFRFTDTATAEQRRAVPEALAALPATIPELRDYRVGLDAGVNDDTWDCAVVADFDSVADYRTYVADETHQRIIRDVIRPIVAERAAVQYEL